MLEGLAAGGGTYRVATAAYVKGMAQCVGDLSAGECTDCVTQAGQTLRGVCPGSEWAEAYLGKCYARYGMGGGYSEGSGNGKFGWAFSGVAALLVMSLLI